MRNNASHENSKRISKREFVDGPRKKLYRSFSHVVSRATRDFSIRKLVHWIFRRRRSKSLEDLLFSSIRFQILFSYLLGFIILHLSFYAALRFERDRRFFLFLLVDSNAFDFSFAFWKYIFPRLLLLSLAKRFLATNFPFFFLFSCVCEII